LENVQERISQVAPFLLLDKDPYAVVSEGRQYWIQDAYTTSTVSPTHSRKLLFGSASIHPQLHKAVMDMYDEPCRST